jgi:hypothetical protein
MCLLAFNWYGYRLLVAYWQQRDERMLETQLDKEEFDESALLSIKVPITTLSYYTSTEFERFDGSVIIGDVAYRYVKRRLLNDSIELLCIPDTKKMTSDQALRELLRKEATHGNFPNTGGGAGKNVQKIYSPTSLNFLLNIPDPIEQILAQLPAPRVLPGYERPAKRPPNEPKVII